MTKTLYIVRRTGVKKYWVVIEGKKIRFPRISQLRVQIRCLLLGHRMGEWHVDDYEGPGEQVGSEPEEWMPYLTRKAHEGEWATRACKRRCGRLEERSPADEAPPLFRGKHRWLLD